MRVTDKVCENFYDKRKFNSLPDQLRAGGRSELF